MSGIIGLISVSAATVGAGPVTSAHLQLAGSISPQTIYTPTSGFRVRLVAWEFTLGSNAGNLEGELYFGTGATIAANPTKAVAHMALEIANQSMNTPQSYPDGAGPIGAVDDVVSCRVDATGDNARVVIHFREE